jgi:hypothetical protein
MAGDLLTRDDIIRGLRDLVAEARNTGATGRIHLVGGAALALRYFERRTTSDVDASIAPERELLAASRTVAARNGWDPDWLNTNASMFVPFAKDPEWETLYEDERVVIRVASPQALLAMKLNAGRRGRDDDDIEALMAICGIADADAAEDLFEEFYPGEVIPDRGQRLLSDILAAGEPSGAPTPPRPDLNPGAAL